MHRALLALVIATAVSLPASAGTTVQCTDPSAAFPVTGTVTAVVAGFGSGMPVIVVDDATLGSIAVGLAPIWFLDQIGFSVSVGDEVNLLAYPCATCSVGAVAAWVDNITTGVSATLRDEDGVPLWRDIGGSGGGSGGPWGEPQRFGAHCTANGADMTSAATVQGTVASFTGGPGKGTPVLVLDVDGNLLELVVSPYWAVAAAGLDLSVGTALEVTYAPVGCDGSSILVAISITHVDTGVTVQLRDPETGYPLLGSAGAGEFRDQYQYRHRINAPAEHGGGGDGGPGVGGDGGDGGNDGDGSGSGDGGSGGSGGSGNGN